jgi:hypothetical protein
MVVTHLRLSIDEMKVGGPNVIRDAQRPMFNTASLNIEPYQVAATVVPAV